MYTDLFFRLDFSGQGLILNALFYLPEVANRVILHFPLHFRLHDRKMCVLGLCALIDLEQIPQVLNQVSGQILPAFILLFNGLKRAYACHAEHENGSDDDDEAEDDEEGGKGLVVYGVTVYQHFSSAVFTFAVNLFRVFFL